MTFTARQTAFVEQYVALGVGVDAARAAGYRDGPGLYTTAMRLLKDPAIAAAVADRQADLANQLGLTRQWVLESLKREASTPGAPAARIRALELIGKAHGMFTDRAHVDIGQRVVFTLDMGGPDVMLDDDDGEAL